MTAVDFCQRNNPQHGSQLKKKTEPIGKLTEKDKSPKSNVKSSEGTRAPKAGNQIQNFTITFTVRQSHHMLNAQVKLMLAVML